MTSAPPVEPEVAPRPPRVWVACAALTAATVVALPVFAWAGYAWHGPPGIYAAGTAAGVCWAGALVALVLTAALRGPKRAVSGVLLGMLFRMGVPLVAGILLDRQGGPLAKAGVFGMIVGFYFVTLLVETLLALRLVKPRGKRTRVTEAS